MKSIVLAVATAAIVGFATGASAQSDPKPGTDKGASQYAPGQRSTEPGGAKEFAPGQQRKGLDDSTSPGASEYAPGQQDRTTTDGKKKKRDM